MNYNFGHTQSSDVFSSFVALDSGEFSTRAEFNAFIDEVTKYRLEYMFVPLLGDISGIVIGSVSDDSTLITRMRDALQSASVHEKSERHLVAFMHEFHMGLEDAIADYKATVPYRLHADPNPLMPDNLGWTKGPIPSVNDENVEKAANPSRLFKYNTGDIKSYFNGYAVKCYKHASVFLRLAERFDGSQWENMTIDQYRNIAKTIQGEMPGLVLESLHTYDTRVYIYGQGSGLPFDDDDGLLYIPEDAIDTLRLNYTSSTAATDLVKVTNKTDSGYYAREETKTSTVKHLITPGTSRTFTHAQVHQNMYFTKLARPQAHPHARITLAVNALSVIDLSSLFSGEELGTYGFAPDGTGRIAINSFSNNQLTIQGRKPGETTLTVSRFNPSGSTPLEISITVT